jgi:hypothetical protein
MSWSGYFFYSLNFEVIIQDFHTNTDTNTNINNGNAEFDLLKENEFLKSQIEFLQSQILKKDDQIKTLFNLVENSQVLLKNEQQTRLLQSVEQDTKKGFLNWFKKSTKNNTD